MATHAMPPLKPQQVVRKQNNDWTKPAAMAIPKEGYFKYEQGNYGPVFPQTPACYGFTGSLKLKDDRAEVGDK